MSDLNGKQLSQTQTPNPADWSSNDSAGLTRLRNLRRGASLLCAAMLLVLVTVLSACATPSPPDAWPTNPKPPQLSEPIPQNSYSSKAQTLIESWLKRLTDTPPM